MMPLYELIDATGITVNVIEWDGKVEWSPPEGHSVRPYVPAPLAPTVVTQQVKDVDCDIVVFTFPKAGCVYPMHRHEPAEMHYTLGVRGAVRIRRGPMIEAIDCHPGDWLDPGLEHELIALEDDSCVWNIFKTAKRIGSLRRFNCP
jgi:quercetin dioxygenase-like cupin family protein